MKLASTCVLALFVFCSIVSACPDEVNCLQCDTHKAGEKDTCRYCENSFLDKVKKTCVSKVETPVDHCKEYSQIDNKVVCNRCDLGFKIDSDNNVCVNCSVESCAICDNDIQICSGCFEHKKYDFFNNTCLKDTPCGVENCDICNTIDYVITCAFCATGFSVVSGTGACAAGPANCNLIEKEGDKECSTCDWGFYIAADGVCKANDSPSFSHWWVWLVLVLVALAVVGYFVYNHFQKQNADMAVYQNV